MSDKQPNRSVQPANEQAKKMKITNEMVIAISDRIYGMLLRELKIERERQRLLHGPQHR